MFNIHINSYLRFLWHMQAITRTKKRNPINIGIIYSMSQEEFLLSFMTVSEKRNENHFTKKKIKYKTKQNFKTSTEHDSIKFDRVQFKLNCLDFEIKLM